MTASEIPHVQLKVEEWRFSRGVSRLIGTIAILLAVVSAFTIVGIPIAILMFIGGALFWNAGRGTAKFTCPRCGHKERVFGQQLNVTCKKCKLFAIVDWPA